MAEDTPPIEPRKSSDAEKSVNDSGQGKSTWARTFGELQQRIKKRQVAEKLTPEPPPSPPEPEHESQPVPEIQKTQPQENIVETNHTPEPVEEGLDQPVDAQAEEPQAQELGKYYTEKRERVIEAVKSGTDKEGNVLYTGTRDVLTNEPGQDKPTAEVLGQLGASFKSARENLSRIKKLQEEGNLQAAKPEIAKMLATIEQMNGHLKMEMFSAETEGENKDLQILQKAEEHLNGELLDRVSGYYMEGYYRQRVQVEIHADRARAQLPKDKYEDFSRYRVTREAFPLAIEEKKLGRIGGKLARRLKDNKYTDDYKSARNERLSYENLSEFVSLDEWTEEEVQVKVEEVNENYGKEIEGQRYSEHYENIADEVKRPTLEKMAEIDAKIDVNRADYGEAINASNHEGVRRAASEIRDLQMEQKRYKAELKVKMYEQAIHDSSDSFGEAIDELQTAFTNGEGYREAVGKIISSGKTNVEARFRTIGQKILNRIRPAIDELRIIYDKLSDWGEQVGGKFVKALRESKLGRAFDWVSEKLNSATSALKEIKTRAKVEALKATREFDKRFVDSVYGAKITARRSIVRGLGGISENIGSEEKRRRASETKAENLRKIHEQSKSKKQYDFFNSFIEKYAKDTEVPEEVLEPTPEAENEPAQEEVDQNNEDVSKTELGQKMSRYKELQILKEPLDKISKTALDPGGRILNDEEAERLDQINNELSEIDDIFETRFGVLDGGLYFQYFGALNHEEGDGEEDVNIDTHQNLGRLKDELVDLSKKYYSREVDVGQLSEFYDKAMNYINSNLGRATKGTREDFLANFKK
jgi:DNA-binding protein Fis